MEHAVDRVVHDAESLWSQAVKTVKLACAGIKRLLLGNLIILLIVLFTAYILVEARRGFMWIAPKIIAHSGRWDAIINAVADTFVLMDDAIILIVKIIRDVVFFFGKRGQQIDTSGMSHFKKIPHYSTTFIRETLINWTTTCANVTSPGELVSLAVKLQVGDSVCPYLRASYPLGWPGEQFRSVAGWLSPPANPIGGNCNLPADSPRMPCVYLGAGYLVFDILVPFLLITVLLGYTTIESIVKTILKTLKLALQTVTLPLQLAVLFVVGAEKELKSLLHRHVNSKH